ncbi:MAG: hypothetical protein E7277_00240 [Lachnospiraceae bacterium]|jgi:multimeric flavodoxin WrbA|nr:hypothetical protein [Lachnospiraceae bacterium]
MKTTIISFSSRQNGNCAQIARRIQSLVKEPVLFDFSELDIHPCGKCNYECFNEREKCPYMQDAEYGMLEAITQSAMVYFVLPNYCDYPCANYFIFNERSQCFFQGKPELLDLYEKVPKRSIVVSNTNETNFVTALSYQTADAPDVLFLSAKSYGKRSISGDLLSSEKAVADLTAFVKAKDA